ncbi:Crp/Fnr family transcriptional regulator [Streptomyces piniterrae]|uniref:Crp/Fnr family transcriptional regulator n=1 Tax=Streptomyces piniterrae TaxID=2571125 RepID=A0A4U0MMP0_9ACTN|nr:Crp/Fnr family transcriptional regulator [Streptomyces piniterrae]
MIRAAGRTRTWQQGVVLFLEGDPPDSVALIEEGLVKITADSDNGYTSLLAIRGPGELIGEMACLDGRTRSATVTAMQTVRGTVVTSERFLALLEEHGPLALSVIRSITARLRDSDGLRADQGALPAGVRVARVLLGLALRHGTAPPGQPGSRALSVNQQELAGAAGTSRESVVRTLRRLQDHGLVTTSRGRTLVLDLRTLARWASG